MTEEGEPSVPDPADIAAEARTKLAESHDDELEARLQGIERAAAKGQAHFRQAQPKPEDGGPSQGLNAEEAKGLGVGLTVAYAILGCPLLGFAIGFLVDQATHTTLWRGLLGLLGCVAGIGYAVVIANRAGQSRR